MADPCAALNGTQHSNSKPIEAAITLAHNPEQRINIHLTILAASVVLFVTSTNVEAPGARSVGLGSLVFAMPDRNMPSSLPLSTTLYASHTQDFATRLAKSLARKLQKPTYVGSSVNLSPSYLMHALGGGGNGGGFGEGGVGGQMSAGMEATDVEVEVEAFKAIVHFVVGKCQAVKPAI